MKSESPAVWAGVLSKHHWNKSIDLSYDFHITLKPSLLTDVAAFAITEGCQNYSIAVSNTYGYW